MARHDEKTSVGRAKVLSGGDTGYRLAEVDEVLGAWLCRQLEDHEAELECDCIFVSTTTTADTTTTCSMMHCVTVQCD